MGGGYEEGKGNQAHPRTYLHDVLLSLYVCLVHIDE